MNPAQEGLPAVGGAVGAAIVVVGSANQDYLVRVSAPPAPGETVLADSLQRQPGGKGANQAVAAARLGGAVSFVGCVGDDQDGTGLVAALRAAGVDTGSVAVAPGVPTGLALVSVHDSGENSITVVPGANFALTVDHVGTAVARLVGGDAPAIVVVQAELTAEVMAAALRTGAEHGARCVLNLAPYRQLDPDVLGLADPLVVNESEASALLGSPVDGGPTAESAAAQLLGQVRSVVITLGAAGAVWADTGGSGRVPARTGVTAVDTTGAGDAFVGALAASLARGADLPTATALGVAAGTFSITQLGAQSSYPTLADLGPHV